MAIIVISTSNSPYEQWLVDGLVVLVTWQWWWQTLAWLLWGLLEVVVCQVRTEPIAALQAAACSGSMGLGCVVLMSGRHCNQMIRT